jgi:MFS family permease
MVNQDGGLRHPTAKLAVLMSGNVLMTLMISSVMPASSAIARNFSALGQVDLHAQILLLAPYIALIFVAPLIGVLIKNYGRRVPLLAAIGLYACAGAAELFTNGFWALVGERVLLGAGGGAITTICMTLAGDYFTGAKRTWAVALVGMATAPGSVVVLLISGVLAYGVYPLSAGGAGVCCCAIPHRGTRRPGRGDGQQRHAATVFLAALPGHDI